MSAQESIFSILVMAAVTFFTRLLPFLLFDRPQGAPKVVLRLSQALPSAIMAMLVVYCLKDLAFTSVGGWAPAVIACAAVCLLQIWKKNDLVSIFGGTAAYMLLLYFC